MDKSINEPVNGTHIMDKVDDEEKPFIDGFSQSSNISLLYQNTDPEFPNLNEELQVQAEESENDNSRLENVDYPHCLEATDLNLPVMNSLHYNVDNTLMNIKQEVEVDQETFERFDQNDHFYIFKNSDIQDIDSNVSGGMLIETMKIKEEILEHQGQTLIETFCWSDEKYDSKFEITNLKTERNGSEIKTDNSELEFENNNIDENSCANIKLADLKSENVPTTFGKLDADNNLENMDLSVDSHASIEDNSYDSVNRKSNIDNSLLTDNKCNFENRLTELDIMKCTSQNEAIHLTASSTDSITDSLNSTTNTSKLDNRRFEERVDFQPIVLLKRLPDTILKDGTQVYIKVIQKEFCASTNTFPLSHDNCYSEGSDKLQKQMKKASDVRPYVRDICKAKLKLQISPNKDIVVHKTERPHRSCSFKPVKRCKFCGSNPGALNDCNMCNVSCKDLKCKQVHSKHMISQGFKTASNLRQHMISDHTDSPHQCGLCNKGFKTVASLSQHMICHRTERPHQCNVCNIGFKTVASLSQHMICHRTERPHQCNVCNKGFKTVASLTQHMICHRTERPHQCNVCNIGFKTVASLSQHMICHRTERPDQCNVCNKGFKTVASLSLHMICHRTERPHQCNVCNKGFKTVTFLKRHMIRHSTERPHQCSVCNKGFKTVEEVGYHMIRHSDKRYKTVQTLKQHMAIHSTVRPHQCGVCNKGFKRVAEVRRHMISHSTERPHQCSVCNKRFKRMAALRKHRMLHSTIWPYQGNMSDKGFKEAFSQTAYESPHQCSVHV